LHKLSEDLQRFESLVAELREVKELLQLIFTEEEEQNEEQDGSGCGAGVLNGANSDGALSSSSSSATSDLKLECEARINAVSAFFSVDYFLLRCSLSFLFSVLFKLNSRKRF